MSTTPKDLRDRVFGEVLTTSASGGESGQQQESDPAAALELRRYVDVIEASLREGEGTYTGTIAPARPLDV